MKKIEGSIYKGHDEKVYVIYPDSKGFLDRDDGLDYIVAETNFMQRAKTLKEAEDELLVFIELKGNM
jgi:predicted RNase H-like HicB family nuclease